MKVGDSDLKPREEVLKLYQIQVVGTRTKRQIPILIEGIREEVTFELRAAWNGKGFDTEISKDWLKLVDLFYRKVWQKSGFKEKPPAEGEGYLVRFGFGSSCWATSFLLLQEVLGIKGPIKPPRTKRLVEGKIPLGWCLIHA